MRKFVIFHLPVVIYGGIIITLSSIPNLKSPRVELFAVDKVAHFIEYAVFAFLVFRSFVNHGPRLHVNYAFLISAGFIVLFALGDEFHQRFVPGRQADIKDFLVDIFAAFLVLTFFRLRHRKLYRTTT